MASSSATSRPPGTGPPADPARLEFTPHPAWPPALARAFKATRAVFRTANTASVSANGLRIAGALSNLLPSPSVAGSQIRRESIPSLRDVLIENMREDDLGGVIQAEWVQHEGSAGKHPDKVILYLHGGAFIVGSRKTHRTITTKIAKLAECKLLAIDYRLSPDHVFPLALHDVISAYSFLTNPPKNSNTKAYIPENVVIMGDSAGGNLAIALALWLRDFGASANLRLPGGLGLLSPVLDLTHSSRSWQTNGHWDYIPFKLRGKLINENRPEFYANDNITLRNPLVSPVFANESDTAPLCPVLIQIGECERMRDENLQFATRIFTSSPIQLEMFESMVHVFQLFNDIDSFADNAIVRLCSFARRVLSDSFAKNEFERKVTYVRISEGFPTLVLSQEDVDNVLQQGSFTLPSC
ncbi:hypothetical protein HDU82_005721 [Entophlyctis luteolus]|nr:hypothetical protein HDU82_005721 [Entophlyctis luteolus]